ncbi:hypothetical protein FGU71_01100 [Erythrobacter insulae]|uniref:Glycosyltransferase RgtA/B/C/D-like domain-containing protein n=1 Tax=Erythrobacter insulae TaxID=2584124 RepID=A0A547P8X9_9SPHN|nr:hypothetical protein [Erythrobacter insulae]TRD10600.1 hypothetical protein FGU71_01100 [Erythrobacter insulae]
MTAAATPARIPERTGLSLPAASSAVWLYALVGVLAAMHLSSALGRSVNWDEFWFYSQVETVARGEFIQPLQTIHTRFFAWWLPAMPGSEIDHIIIARLTMFVCLAITALGIMLTAEKFSDRRTALIAVGAYLGAGFVLQHGSAFRVDPIVAACLTIGLAIAARTQLKLPAILALGALIGLAGMVTIKFVLWAPAFAGIALYRWDEEGFDWRYPLRWIAAGVTAIAVFAALYALHSAGAAEQATQSASGTLGSSASRMIGFLDNVRFDIVSKGAVTALPLLIAAALVPWIVLKSNAGVTRRIAIIGLWLPVLTPLFYYNSFPYFYVFILPPVAVACAFSLPVITQRYGTALVAAVIALSAAAVWIVDARGVTEKQRILVDAVHQVFPDPVNYFDCCGMIAPFPKANHFRTQWGVDQYLSTGRPVMLETMQAKPVPLLVDNNREFTSALLGIRTDVYHPDDFAALQTTFVRHWGDIFVAGRDLDGGEQVQWDVLVPGIYTVKGDDLIIGQTVYSDGETVTLDRGQTPLANPGQSKTRLIWGDNLPIPAANSPEKYWTAF